MLCMERKEDICFRKGREEYIGQDEKADALVDDSTGGLLMK